MTLTELREVLDELGIEHDYDHAFCGNPDPTCKRDLVAIKLPMKNEVVIMQEGENLCLRRTGGSRVITNDIVLILAHISDWTGHDLAKPLKRLGD